MTGRTPPPPEPVVATAAPLVAATPLGAAGSSTRALVLSILVTGGAGLVWFVLATATGLVFHFLPGATFLAGAWAYRWRPTTGRTPWPHVAAILVTGVATTSASLLALVAGGHPLDGGVVTVAVAVAGATLAMGWLRWKGSRRGAPAVGPLRSDRPAAPALQEEDGHPRGRDEDADAPTNSGSD